MSEEITDQDIIEMDKELKMQEDLGVLEKFELEIGREIEMEEIAWRVMEIALQDEEKYSEEIGRVTYKVSAEYYRTRDKEKEKRDFEEWK